MSDKSRRMSDAELSRISTKELNDRAKWIANWTMVGAAPERPVSSQLSRIEQDVKAALEGQARLNGIIDKLGQRQELIRQQSIQQIEHVQERISGLNALVDGLRVDVSAHREQLEAALQVAQLREERYKEVERHFTANDVRWASIDRRIAEIFGFMAKGQRLASKKPSHKARHAKRST